MVGYTGGTTPDPTYRSIGDHTEALRVTFDPQLVSFEQILLKFWEEHDPMPFAFTGSQYRSAVWHHTPTQEAVVNAVRKRLDGDLPASSSSRDHTAIGPAGPFYRAEEYHQRFISKQAMAMRI